MMLGIICKVRTRNCENHKVPQPSIIQNLQLFKVNPNSRRVNLSRISLIPRIPNIIHPHPDTHNRILPLDPLRVVSHIIAEDLHLIDETQDGRVVGRYDLRVNGCAARGEVVAQDGGVGGVGRDEVAEPVEPAGGGPAGERGIAERV